MCRDTRQSPSAACDSSLSLNGGVVNEDFVALISSDFGGIWLAGQFILLSCNELMVTMAICWK